MYTVSYRDLHKEHLEWLSFIKIWKDELTFLSAKCDSKLDHKANDNKELLNNLSHHQRLLSNMESQIHSHESFLKEMLEMDGADFEHSSTNDHDHNREHMESFQISFAKLKKAIYRRTKLAAN